MVPVPVLQKKLAIPVRINGTSTGTAEKASNVGTHNPSPKQSNNKAVFRLSGTKKTEVLNFLLFQS
jgi:hypothetical protein